MAYVAVNKEGIELIFTNLPIRIAYWDTELDNWRDDTAYYELDSRLSDSFYNMYGNKYCGIQLPKGSIYRLIGKTLTWENNPIEIK